MTAKVYALTRSIKRQLQIIAKGDMNKPKHLQVLKDKAGYSTAQKLYAAYVSQEDFSKFPLFCQDLDNLLHRYGGQAEAEADDQQADQKADTETEADDGRDKF